MKPPDWRRLGARFGVPDVCVAFPAPATVRGPRGAVAERVIALREATEGVALEVESGLVLTIAGARVISLDPGLRGALLAVPAARTLRIQN